MKRLIIIVAVAFLGLSSFKEKADSVYLCMGAYSHFYHKITYCKGLKNCSTKLKKISLADAINQYGRKACHYCYH